MKTRFSVLRALTGALIAVLSLGFFSNQALAVVCSNVYQNDNGENPGLSSPGEQLDLSGVSWSSSGSLPSGSLDSGDYYVGGGDYDPIVLSPGATVRIFVDGNLTLDNNAKINAGGDPSKLLIVVRGNISAGNNATISGLLYATGSIDVGQGQGRGAIPDIAGGLAAQGGIVLPRRTEVSTDYSGINEGLLSSLCSRPVELLANGISGPVVEVGIGELVNVTAVAQQCPEAEYPPISDRWADNWFLNGQFLDGYSGNSSPCDRSPVTVDSRSFNSEGDYVYRYQTEYCREFLCFGWLGGRETFADVELTVRVQGSSVDHFRIIHGGTGVTCQPTPITFQAMDAQGNIVTDYDGQVSLSTSTGEGFWQAGNGAEGNLTLLSGNTGQAFYQFSPADGGQITLGLQHTEPDAVNVNIADGSIREIDTADPDLMVRKAGFLFHQGADFDSPVGSQISGKPSPALGEQALRLTAIREADDTGACEAFLVGPQNVDVGLVCENPGACSASGVMDVNDVELGKNATGTLATDPSANDSLVPFDFGNDSTSSAPLVLKYNDAGSVSLFASMPLLDDEGNPTGELISGSSGPFTVTPAGFCVEATKTAGASYVDLTCSSVDAECSISGAAGDIFNLTISAVAWEQAGEISSEFCDNPVTSNFEYSDLSLDSRVVAPASGKPASLLTESITMAPQGEGAVVFDQSISEVGVFEIFIPEGQSYWGASLPGGGSDPIGRFTPAQFEVVIADKGELQSKCQDKQFMGQPMGWPEESVPTLTITALNQSGVPTENYTNSDNDYAFMKLTGGDITVDFPDSQTVIENSESIVLTLDVIQNEGELFANAPGEMYYEFSANDKIWFEKNENSRVASFPPELSFAVQAFSDSDGVPSGDLPDPFLTGPEEDSNDAFKMYYGRLNMENVYGPQNIEKLLMPVHIEVWDGTIWNITDFGVCMPSDLTQITEASETTQNYHELDDPGFDESSGAGNYYLALEPKSGSCPEGGECTDTLEWPLASGADLENGEVPKEYDWLMDFWGRNPNPNPDELQNPQGLATFGVYRGNDRIIYWQEVLN